MIIVRRARKGERFTAIDDSQHELTVEMLVIADAERVVALAGIMGGKETEVCGADILRLVHDGEIEHHFLAFRDRRA